MIVEPPEHHIRKIVEAWLDWQEVSEEAQSSPLYEAEMRMSTAILLAGLCTGVLRVPEKRKSDEGIDGDSSA